MPRNMLMALAVSACLALVISLVPAVTRTDQGGDIAAYRPYTPMVLSEQNLVDLFTILPTHYNIKHVKWENRSLYVDIAVTPTERLEEHMLYRDVYSLLYRSFQLTRNVEHLFFRLLEKERDRSAKLLIAIEADRPRGVFHFPPPEQMDNPQQVIHGLARIRIEPGYDERFIR
ncbi:MAG: hypothetical protein H0Z34_04705 [Brevibacillus sp.]|nr:hypothetical protein [Brevibacillus sp.]